MAKKVKRPPHISKEDWDGVDIPELTQDDAKRLRPAKDLMPSAVKRAIGQRGPGKKPKKIAVSLRLDPEVIEGFKKTGDRWQSRINAVLKENLRQAVASGANAKRTKTRPAK